MPRTKKKFNAILKAAKKEALSPEEKMAIRSRLADSAKKKLRKPLKANTRP